jgi:hypothetical protein
MYGLPQAGKVASDSLLPRLTAAGYTAGVTPGLFKHATNSIIFAPLVQYSTDEDLVHLQDTLCQHYQITVDKEASIFCGMTLEWNYTDGHVTISMSGYNIKHSNDSPTLTQHGHNTLRMLGRHQQMAAKYNMLTLRTPPCHSPMSTDQGPARCVIVAQPGNLHTRRKWPLVTVASKLTLPLVTIAKQFTVFRLSIAR